MTAATSVLLDPEAHPVIAHRGASAFAPENTLVGFERGAAFGAEAFELDVHVTADDVPVVIHDPTLDRTTDRRGVVASMRYDAIREADAGARFTSDRGATFPFNGRGVHVPTLADVLGMFPETPCIVELKTASAAPAVRRVIEQSGAMARCVLASFDERALAPFDAPPWIRSATRAETLSLLSRALVGRAPRPARYRALTIPTRFNGIPIPMRMLAGAARRVGAPTHVWVIDSPELSLALWGDGVCGVITNRPGAMLAAREAGRVGPVA
ncbi:MAG: glycerophosphodiester phosphodiesterase family protein [Gemmatimonadaceae bacterium]